MGSKLLLLVLFSLSVTSGYALSTRDVVSKQKDETYVMATTGQGYSMIDVADLAKPRSLRALVDGSKVAVNKKGASKSTPSKKDRKKTKKKKMNSINSGELVGIIIAAIILTIIIICVIYYLYNKHKTKKAQRCEQEKTNVSSETKTSKEEHHV